LGNFYQLDRSLLLRSCCNRGTETQQSTSDFNVNGNLLTLDNIGTLNWHYNNTLGKLKKADSNTSEITIWYSGLFVVLS
jgi:hypothetical protein